MGDDEKIQRYIDEIAAMQQRVKALGGEMRDRQLPAVDSALCKAHDALRDAIEGFAWVQAE